MSSDDKESAWEQAWGVHAGRFAAELKALREAARERPPPAAQYTRAQLQELAFGAYIGLVREGGDAAGGSEAQVVRVRQTALGRIQELATVGGRAAAARPVLVQALGDPNQAVRLQAFDQLAALGVDADTLGAAALGAGHTDVGVRGLEALAGGGTSAEGQAVLEEALRTRSDELAIEAAKLLMARRGTISVAGLGLAAAYEPMRRQAVNWLAAEYEKAPAARDALRQALQSRHREVVESAAEALALRKDPAAFDTLVRLLHAAKEAGPQQSLIEVLEALGDPRTPDAFLDRIEKDPEGTASTGELFEAAGKFRLPTTADRFLRMAGTEKWRQALEAAYVVSGYDQPIDDLEIDDSEDENPDQRWLEKQFPRHDAILARVLQRAVDLKANRFLGDFLPRARWAKGREVDPILAVLTVYADDSIRNEAVEAVGWRLRKRGGPADPLLKGLKHRNPVTQLLAAEGLARGGRAEGLSVLLAAVDLQSDLDLRQRAVQALGELGDARALDLLLKIVNDPEHLLRDEAAEALGRMGRSAKAGEILQLLEELARDRSGVADGALRGLRWFDHPEGWQLIRRLAAELGSETEETAVELLGYNDDPATRDLLLRLLVKTVDSAVFSAALTSAQRLWGQQSPDPDYAAVQNTEADPYGRDDLFRRLQEHGDARRLLEILPKLDSESAERLEGILLNRQPVPVAEAQAVIAGPDAVAAGVAAHLLGRAGTEASASGAAGAAALRRWWAEWDKGRQEEARRGSSPGALTAPLTRPLHNLVWAASRFGVAADTLLAIATTRTDVPFDRPLRRAAVAALAAGKLAKPVLTALEGLATGDDPEVRAMAAEVVARANAARAPEVAGRVLSDRVAFNRVAARNREPLTATLRGAAVQVHYQGVAVPHLVAGGDVAGLAAVAGNRALPEDARLGALEGLAAAASEAAEAELKRIGESAEAPEELRKTAWRGLRRSRRARARKAAK